MTAFKQRCLTHRPRCTERVLGEKGAFTGESSCDMLKSARLHLLHHRSLRAPRLLRRDRRGSSTRRPRPLVAAGLVPIFCVGESLEVREAGHRCEHVVKQVKAGLAGLEITCRKCVVAYEPIWAIGTGKTATAEQAQEVCAAIRETSRELFGEELANGIRFSYGGS